MLYYAQKLTKEPSNMKKRDVEALKKVGFSDRDITRLLHILTMLIGLQMDWE